MNYLSRLRAAENFPKSARGGSVESIEKAPKPILDTLDTTPAGPFSKLQAKTEARSRWYVVHADGRITSNSYTPPATMDVVRALHPAALEIEADDE